MPLITHRKGLVIGVISIGLFCYWQLHAPVVYTFTGRCRSPFMPKSHDGIFEVPIKRHGHGGFYKRLLTIDFALGCPPQQLTALPFLDPYEADYTGLEVHATNCKNANPELAEDLTQGCPENIPKYDSSASWTQRYPPSPFNHYRGGIPSRYGYPYLDIFSVSDGALQVSGFQFLVWNGYDFEGLGDGPGKLKRRMQDTAGDFAQRYTYARQQKMSVFSLAFQRSHYGWRSPFQAMIEEQTLRRNMFALKLPRDEDEVGSIVLGACDRDILQHQTELVSHPVFPPNATAWSIEASSITAVTPKSDMTDTTRLIHHSLIGYQAILLTSEPLIYLPNALFDEVIAAIGARRGICHPHVVDCSRAAIDALPTITFTFGHTQEISLSGQDYIQKMVGPPAFETCHVPHLEECVPAFRPLKSRLSDLVWPSMLKADVKDYILIGTVLLEMVYSIFEYDEQTVSFALLDSK